MTDLEVSRMSKDSLLKTVEGVVFFAGHALLRWCRIVCYCFATVLLRNFHTKTVQWVYALSHEAKLSLNVMSFAGSSLSKNVMSSARNLLSVNVGSCARNSLWINVRSSARNSLPMNVRSSTRNSVPLNLKFSIFQHILYFIITSCKVQLKALGWRRRKRR